MSMVKCGYFFFKTETTVYFVSRLTFIFIVVIITNQLFREGWGGVEEVIIVPHITVSHFLLHVTTITQCRMPQNCIFLFLNDSFFIKLNVKSNLIMFGF